MPRFRSRPGARRALVASAALAGLLSACGASPSSPPPAESHANFAPLEVDLTGNPDWLIAGAGSLWVKRDDGVVTRLDPASGEVIAEIDAKQVPNERPCNGIGVSAESIWTCSEQSVVRIDPATNAVAATIPAGKIWSQGRLLEAAGRIWVLSGTGDQLVGVSTADGTVGEPIALPAACVDLGALGDVLYAACTDDDAVLRIDPATGDVTKVAVETPNHVAATEQGLWVASGAGLLRLDPTTLATGLTIPEVVPGAFGGILATDEAVWVRQESPFLTRVDAATGVQTLVVSAPHGSGDVIVDGDQVWTSDVEGNALLRLTIPDAE